VVGADPLRGARSGHASRRPLGVRVIAAGADDRSATKRAARLDQGSLRVPRSVPRGDTRRGWFAGEAPDFRRRGAWLVLVFAAMTVAVIGRLFQVQVLQGATLARQAAAQHTTSITLHGTRGLILDRYGRVLASNEQVFDVFADP